jgi:methylphosphotriester-DNA--protein-cysteine methyltransferase
MNGTLHAIVDGEASLWAHDPGAALRMLPGDVVLVRENTEHHLGAAAGARCLALARGRLRDSDARLATIGESLGYASEFSFAAAFKRHHGSAPGRWRAGARTPV